MPFAQQRARTLPAALASGRVVDRADVERAAGADRSRPSCGSPPGVATPRRPTAERRRLRPRTGRWPARSPARSMVLLRNEPVDDRPLLPLDRAALRRRRGGRPAGRRARTPATTARPTSAPPEVVTPLAGLRAALPAIEVTHATERPATAVEQPGRGRRGGGRRLHRRGRGRVRRLVRSPSWPPSTRRRTTRTRCAELARAWDAGPQLGRRRPRLAAAHPRTRQLIQRRRRGESRARSSSSWPAAAVTMEAVAASSAGDPAWPGTRGWRAARALADVLLGDARARRPPAVRRPARRGRPAAVRQARHHGDLRPVARPAAARPGRQGAGLPARIRPVVHVVHAVATSRSSSTAIRAPGRPGDRGRTPATGRAATSFRSTRPGPPERADLERFLVGFARVDWPRASGCRRRSRCRSSGCRRGWDPGGGRYDRAATGSTWARAPRIRLRCP